MEELFICYKTAMLKIVLVSSRKRKIVMHRSYDLEAMISLKSRGGGKVTV